MSKTRRCKACKKKLPIDEAMIVNINAFCNWECCLAYTKTDAAKKVEKKMRRRERIENKEKLKTLHHRLAEAQIAFNSYIRIRDKWKPCVSCGTPPTEYGRGGSRDASHYLARGSSKGGSFNRFNWANVHSSCKKCNRFLAGNLVPYRVELIKRIGLDRVEAIENTNKIKKWNHTDLKRIKVLANRKRRLYERKFR